VRNAVSRAGIERAAAEDAVSAVARVENFISNTENAVGPYDGRIAYVSQHIYPRTSHNVSACSSSYYPSTFDTKPPTFSSSEHCVAIALL
jgi:hypothetical protein